MGQMFVPIAHVCLAIALVIERFVSRLEGCECHGAIWRQGRKHRCRSEMVANMIGGGCVWKGRQGPWLVAEGIDELQKEINECTSEPLETLTMSGSVANETKSEVVAVIEQARLRLKECVLEKLNFWNRIPWRAICIFHCCIEGDIQRSKAIARQCVEEFDKTLEASLHRVAIRLLSPNKLSGADLRKFVADDQGLPPQDCSHAWVPLQEYAFSSLVERRVESIHDQIKRLGSQAANISAPYICAKTREAEYIALLKLNGQCHQCCLNVWHRKNFPDAVLGLRYSAAALSKMSSLQKVRAVYQCDLESVFRDMSTAQQRTAVWLAVALPQQALHIELPTAWKHCFAFFKFLVVDSECFSLPTTICQAWAGCEVVGDGSRWEGNPIDNMMDASLTARWDLDCNFDDIVIIRVIKAAPEATTLISVPQLPRSMTWVQPPVNGVGSTARVQPPIQRRGSTVTEP